MTWIKTYNGNRFDYAETTVDMIFIAEIAQALARECRYANHCHGHISVAEHSLLVSWLLPPRLALAGLLHDAAEAYMRDIPKPLKDLIGERWTDIEDRIQGVIYTKYGITLTAEDRAEIKRADMRIMRLEASGSIKGGCEDWPALAGVEYPTGMCVHHLTEFQAEYKFLREFNRLMEARKAK